MTNNRYRGAMILGIIVFLCVAVVLVATPSSLFSPMVTFIDSELYNSSGHEAFVNTTTDFGSTTQMAAFPRIVGKWTGADFPVSEYVKLLGADVMLVRSYEPSTFTQPVFLVIVQAKTESSFHPPKVCVVAQGDEVQEEGEVTIDVTDAAWVKGPSTVSVPLKKLVVVRKNAEGTIIERRILLFCYVKGNQFYSDTITMIQIEALAPIQGSYEDSLKEQKDFITQAVPLMFSPGSDSQWSPLFFTFTKWGIGGYLLILILLLAPISLIVYAAIRRRKGPER
jgi:hypothetical protein